MATLLRSLSVRLGLAREVGAQPYSSADAAAAEGVHAGKESEEKNLRDKIAELKDRQQGGGRLTTKEKNLLNRVASHEKYEAWHDRQIQRTNDYVKLLTEALPWLRRDRLRYPHRSRKKKADVHNEQLKDARIANTPVFKGSFLKDRVNNFDSLPAPPPTVYQEPWSDAFKGTYGQYIPGRLHNWCGVDKVWPLRCVPATAAAYFGDPLKYPHVFAEDTLLPSIRALRNKPQADTDRRKFSAPYLRIKRGRLDLSRKAVQAVRCEDDRSEDFQEFRGVRYLDPLDVMAKRERQNCNLEVAARLRGKQEEDQIRTYGYVLSAGEEAKDGLSSAGSYYIDADQPSEASLGAQRPGLLDELSVQPYRIEVRLEQNKKFHGKNYSLKKSFKEKLKLVSLKTKERRIACALERREQRAASAALQKKARDRLKEQVRKAAELAKSLAKERAVLVDAARGH